MQYVGLEAFDLGDHSRKGESLRATSVLWQASQELMAFEAEKQSRGMRTQLRKNVSDSSRCRSNR